MKQYATEQETFWAGRFGDDYIVRNQGEMALAANVGFWAQIIHRMGPISSCLELGPNIGLNLKTLGVLLPDLQMTAVEINNKAAAECARLDRVKVVCSSIFEVEIQGQFDLTFTCGVLIHINPERLSQVYDILYRKSKKYILISEYYNPTPVEVNYRGHEGKLFKRDFAGEIMDQHPDLRLRDYGFQYHRDNHFSADDATWFLMEK